MRTQTMTDMIPACAFALLLAGCSGSTIQSPPDSADSPRPEAAPRAAAAPSDQSTIASQMSTGQAIQKSNKLSLKSFTEEIQSYDLATARSQLNQPITPEALEAAKRRLSSLYENLPVVATVQVPIPGSNQVVSFDCVLSSSAKETPPADLEPARAPQPNAPPSITVSKGPSADPPTFGIDETPACPKGTIAKQRITVPEAIESRRDGEKDRGLAHSFTEKGKTTTNPGFDIQAMKRLTGKDSGLAPAVDYRLHRYSHASAPVENTGAAAHLNVWSPRVLAGDMSLSQIWVIGGDANGLLQTVEAGWQVMDLWDPKFPALFVYSTADGYQNTGCYATRCATTEPVRPESFVVTTNRILIGKPIQPQSSVDGPQKVLEIKWLRHPKTGSWWLKVDGEWVGYYPTKYFQKGPLTHPSTYVDFGGEATGVRPTSEMGSGRFAADGLARAAFQSNLRYFDKTGKPMPASNVQPSMTDVECYTISINGPLAPENDPGVYFYFGGPGARLFAERAADPATAVCKAPSS